MKPSLQGLVLFVVFASGALAQERGESHVPVPAGPTNERPMELVTRRLRELQTNQLVQNLKGINEDRLIDPKLREQLLTNPAYRDILNRLSAGDPELMRLIDQLRKTNPKLAGVSNQDLQDAAKRFSPTNPQHNLPPRLPDEARPPMPPMSNRDIAAQKAMTERLGNLLRDYKLNGMADSLTNSPELRNIMQDLSKPGTESPVTFGDVSKFLDQMESWADQAKDLLPKSVNLPRLDLRAPDFGPVREFSFGQSSMPTIPNLSQGATMALAVFAVGGIALLAWRLTARPRGRFTAVANAASYSLFDPDQVASREDLIRAFEQLALVLFGSTAAHWHHRQVADRIAEIKGARPDADALANLYERARYAPQSADVDWRSGRDLLRRLAGSRP